MLAELLARLMAMTAEEQESALAELAALSGILKLDDLLEEKLKEFQMLDTDINLEENAVIRPLIEKGRQRGRRDLLLEQLAEKFGPVPTMTSERVHKASAEELDRWARRILRTTTLEDTLL